MKRSLRAYSVGYAATAQPEDEVRKLEQDLHISHGVLATHVEVPELITDALRDIEEHPVVKDPAQVTGLQDYLHEVSGVANAI